MDDNRAAFDASYLSAWERLRAEPQLFRNTRYEDTQRRELTGELGIIAQYALEHLKNKRPTTLPSHEGVVVDRPYDPALFNFTKANVQREALMWLQSSQKVGDGGALEWTTSNSTEVHGDAHAILVNISPIFGGAGLLVPYLHRCLPQRLTPDVLEIGLAVMRLPARRDFRLGFNSLGAWASVNHMHFHATYVSDTFPSGRFPVEMARSVCIASCALAYHGVSLVLSELVGWPLTGFSFDVQQSVGGATSVGSQQLAAASDVRKLLSATVGAFISHLRVTNTAHNVLLSDCGARVIVLPRQHQRGCGADGGAMAVAFAESCGLAIMYSQEAFDAATEASVVATLTDFRIADDEFAMLRAAACAALNSANTVS